MCPILTMSEEQSVQTGSHIKVISCVSGGHIRVQETRANVQRGKLFTPAMYCSLIWCAAQTAEARTEKVIVNGLFVFMEFAYRRWTVGSDPDSHFFPLWDERERDASGPKEKKRRHMSKEVTWLYQEIELGELKNNTNGDKRRGLCDYALNTIITPLKTELLCNCMHRNEKPTSPQLNPIPPQKLEFIQRFCVVRQSGVAFYCGHEQKNQIW